MVCGSCHANVSQSSHGPQGYTSRWHSAPQASVCGELDGFCQIASVKEHNTQVVSEYLKGRPQGGLFFLREDFLVLSCSVVARHLCWGSLADGEDRVYWHPAAGPYISLVTIPHAADPAPVPTRLCPSLIRFQVMRFSRRNTRSITGLDPAQFETSRNIFIWRTLSENSLLANK